MPKSPKPALDKLGALLKAASFTSKEARSKGVSSSTLAYYVNTGALVRLGRGVYRSVDAPEMDDFHWEDLAMTMATINQGVICLTTALALYELTDEIPRQHWVAIPNETSHNADASTKIVRLRNMDLGINVLDRQDSGLITFVNSSAI